LMISQFFKDAPFTRRQRLCFWAAFLYYMASAALLFTSTLPTLTMVWFYPDKIYWWNYLPLIPAFLGTFFVFPRLARGWGMAIYRVCTINSVCHALAVTDALRQRVAAWVPTGAATRQASRGRSTPRKVALVLRVWIVVVQVLLWAGVARAFLAYPVSVWGYVPAALLGLIQLYMLAPFLVRLDPRPSVRPAPVAVPRQRVAR